MKDIIITAVHVASCVISFNIITQFVDWPLALAFAITWLFAGALFGFLMGGQDAQKPRTTEDN